MIRAVDRALKLLCCQKLRVRSLKLELRQRARLVLVDFSLRERRVADDVGKQIERLIEILNQTAGSDGRTGLRSAWQFRDLVRIDRSGCGRIDPVRIFFPQETITCR